MKTLLLNLLLICPILISANPDPITIDFNKAVIITKYYVEKGDLDLTIIPKAGTYITVAIDKSYNAYDPFDITKKDKDSTEAKNLLAEIPVFELNFNDNTKYEINVVVFDDKHKQLKSYKIELISKSSWYWTTTFGVSAVVLINRDTYKTLLTTEMTPENAAEYTIVKDGSKIHYDPIPTIMFTYAKLENEFPWGFSGGLGTDFQSISVFGGVSKVIGQNIIITGGVALHEQLRLDSKYSKNQIVSSEVSFDDLHSDYFRVNPFLSLTYRLNQNPYKN